MAEELSPTQSAVKQTAPVELKASSSAEGDNNQNADVGKAIRQWCAKNPNVLVAICAFLVGAIVLFLGNGILLRPKLKVTCGSFDLKTPAKLKMEFFMLKTMLAPEEFTRNAIDGIVRSIRESGLPEPRLRQILGAAYDSTNLPLATLTNILEKNVQLSPQEERVVKAAVARGSTYVSTPLISDALVPESIVCFEIENTGWRDARNVRLAINYKGKPCHIAFTTDNKVITKATISNDFYVELEAIAPNSRTKGIIWYGPGFNLTDSAFETRSNELVITYENGSMRQTIVENDFFRR